MQDIPDPDQAHRARPRTGVLLMNLGTPDAATPRAIRRYLREFLSDPRVVELPRALWLPILYGFILPFRPRKLVHAYRSVWTEEGSPLLRYSQRQRSALKAALDRRAGEGLVVELAMTYGTPSTAEALRSLERQQVRRLLVLPLYAQYSATTTAAALEAVFAQLRRQRWLPELRTINSYHDDPGYLGALAQSLREHWSRHGEPDHLLLSFHSIPRRCLERGDPYYCHSQKTARLLAEALQLPAQRWSVSFQSRLGKQPWLMPYTDEVVKQLAARGVRRLDVICPGFSADCLETLEEVAMRYRDDFIAAGGAEYRYVPALNDAPAHIEALADLALRHLCGWPLQEPGDDAALRLSRAGAAQARLRCSGLPD